MNCKEILTKMTLEEKAGLCSGSGFWHTKAVERLGIPKVMMTDGPHGLRKQMGAEDHLGINESIEAVCFPTASALASSFDTELLHTLGEILGEECRAENVAMLLGPGLNMKRSPLCGRNFEYFSEDPYLAGALGASYIRGLQSKGVAACVKHLAVNNQEGYRMSGSSNLDERTLHEIYLPAFEMAVKEGKVRSVMCAYNQVNGEFCSENKTLLTDILRERWGFDGFVVTDWGAVKDRVKGLLAGLDLEMPGSGGRNDAKIVRAVKDGSLDVAVLDRTALLLLEFIEAGRQLAEVEAVFDRQRDHQAAVEMAKSCAVLLKNDGALPLAKRANTVFIGEFAKNPRFQGGGSSHINPSRISNALESTGDGVTFAQGFTKKPGANAQALLEEAVAAARDAETTVIFAGLPDTIESEGFDRRSLNLPEHQNALIFAVAAVQPNTVVVLHCGAPVVMPWLGQVKAVLCLYLGGEGVGEAVTDLLYGKTSPSGKLAETWPLKLADNPSFLNFPGEEGVVDYREGIFMGYRYYDKKEYDVLFPFGHGLSYTSFAYSDLTLDKSEMKDTDTLAIRCKVKNTGGAFGREAVQLYIRNGEGRVTRPVRELRGFAKLALAPGEEKELCFTLDKRAFAYYEPRIHDWHVESGVFGVEIGASSRDIRLCAEVAVKGTMVLPMVFTATTPMGVVTAHPKGREVMAQIRPEKPASSAESPKNSPMGESGAELSAAMAREMPLGSMVTFGIMTAEQLEGLLAILNS